MKLVDVTPPGQTVTLGTYEFTAERIIDFASKFDPQYFHLDAEAAKDSVFGGLCASGWHICAASMKCNVAFLQDQAERITAAGGEPPKFGPSPGFRNLKWLRPVFEGDTVTYSLEVTGERKVPHRPGRNIVDMVFYGQNQKGEPVVQYECSVVEFD